MKHGSATVGNTETHCETIVVISTSGKLGGVHVHIVAYRCTCTISTVAVCTLFHVVYQSLHSYSDISATGPDMVRCLYLHTVEPL